MNVSKCECCNGKTKNLGVILDLDGTLLDTERATKGVLKEFLTKYRKELDMEREKNKRVGMTLKESAAFLVKHYDLPLTPDQFIDEIIPMFRKSWALARPLPGANRLINHLYKNGVPFALASNSTLEYINAKISHQQGWKDCFSAILGSDQVKSGKPAPDLFIEAARRLGVDAEHCLVIEDSLVGVTAGKAAKMTVVAIPSQKEADTASVADSVLNSLLEFQPEQWGLPSFEDWVDDALPIEPFCVNGLCSDGTVSEITAEEGTSALSDQVVGVFFGWADVGLHKICKVVVALGWIRCSYNVKREIHICIVDEEKDHVSDQKVRLQIVGYIRGLTNEAGEKTGKSMEIRIHEEDKAISSAALELPMFIHN